MPQRRAKKVSCTNRLLLMPGGMGPASHGSASSRFRELCPTARCPDRAGTRRWAPGRGGRLIAKDEPVWIDLPHGRSPCHAHGLVSLLDGQALFMRRAPSRRTRRLWWEGLKRMPVVASNLATCFRKMTAGWASTRTCNPGYRVGASVGGRPDRERLTCDSPRQTRCHQR